MYLGIGSLVCIINLQIAPIGTVLMRLDCQGIKELRILVGSDFFQIWKLSLLKPYLCLVTHSYSNELVLRRIKYFVI